MTVKSPNTIVLSHLNGNALSSPPINVVLGNLKTRSISFSAVETIQKEDKYSIAENCGSQMAQTHNIDSWNEFINWNSE